MIKNFMVGEDESTGRVDIFLIWATSMRRQVAPFGYQDSISVCLLSIEGLNASVS